ncbi:MAG TPA: C40 family peptidase [Gemmatimonadaceae bacterium]|jgi:cell wall-associated NlpC family hydrolase|nr:C40 family peptidase [Gemmatimonadaceae bacterium]
MLAALSVISFASLAAVSAAGTDSVKARSLAAATRPEAGSADAVAAPPLSSGMSATTSVELTRSVLTTAARYLGTRYQFGGARPGAFDCSGFVRYVFARHGVALPRTAREQAEVGRTIVGGLDSLRTGDLLFFRTRRGRTAHVAIYVGDGRIIHASAGSRRVRYDDLSSARGRWFIRNLSGVRRVVDHPNVGFEQTRTSGD